MEERHALIIRDDRERSLRCYLKVYDNLRDDIAFMSLEVSNRGRSNDSVPNFYSELHAYLGTLVLTCEVESTSLT